MKGNVYRFLFEQQKFIQNVKAIAANNKRPLAQLIVQCATGKSNKFVVVGVTGLKKAFQMLVNSYNSAIGSR